MPLAERSESTNKQEAAESAANLSWPSWAGFGVSSLMSGSYGGSARDSVREGPATTNCALDS